MCFSQGCLRSSRACVSWKEKEASRKADSFLSISAFPLLNTVLSQADSLHATGIQMAQEASGQDGTVGLCSESHLHALNSARVLSHFNHVWLFEAPWSVLGSSVHRDFPGKDTEVSCHALPLQDLPNTDRTHVPCGSYTAGRFLTSEPLGKYLWSPKLREMT